MKKLSNERGEEIFTQMSNARLGVVGDLMLDRYVWGHVERMSPEAPVPVVTWQDESSNLGGAANVAANVKALGADVQLFGIIGDDTDGECLMDLLEKRSFGTTGVVTVDDRPTIVKTRIIANSQHIVRVDREKINEIDDSTQRKLIVRLRAALGGVNCLIIEDYNKGLLTPSFIKEIIASANELGVKVAVDPKHKNFWDYKGATLFKPNLRELAAALGRPVETEKDLISAGKEVVERLELDYLLVTRGREGMALFNNGEVEFLQTRAHRVHDVSGAGDTVIATIMTALASGADILEAAILANIAASIVIAEVGAVPVDFAELRRLSFES